MKSAHWFACGFCVALIPHHFINGNPHWALLMIGLAAQQAFQGWTVRDTEGGHDE